MVKGYLPYLKSADCENEKAAKFIANYQQLSEHDKDEADEMSVANVHQAILNYLQHEQELKSFSESSRFVDALYSFNVQPANSFSKYLHKAGVEASTESSLKSDWEKVGLDLWLSILKLNQRSPSY